MIKYACYAMLRTAKPRFELELVHPGPLAMSSGWWQVCREWLWPLRPWRPCCSTPPMPECFVWRRHCACLDTLSLWAFLLSLWAFLLLNHVFTSSYNFLHLLSHCVCSESLVMSLQYPSFAVPTKEISEMYTQVDTKLIRRNDLSRAAALH